MRRRHGLPFVVTVMAALAFGACANGDATPAAQPTQQAPVYTATHAGIAMDCELFYNSPEPVQLSRETTIGSGDTFGLSLCSNASTGFTWEDPVISDTTVLELSATGSLPPAEVLPGAAGTETFTFKGLKAGQAGVEMAYSRPWEGGEKGVWKLSLAVTVR